MPRYRVIIHRKASKLLAGLKEEKLKNRIIAAIEKLVDYPLALRELDVEKLEGIERTYRIRIDDYRVIFHVDKKEKTLRDSHRKKRINLSIITNT